MDPVIITVIVGYICICSLIIAFSYLKSDEIKETVKKEAKKKKEKELQCKYDEKKIKNKCLKIKTITKCISENGDKLFRPDETETKCVEMSSTEKNIHCRSKKEKYNTELDKCTMIISDSNCEKLPKVNGYYLKANAEKTACVELTEDEKIAECLNVGFYDQISGCLPLINKPLISEKNAETYNINLNVNHNFDSSDDIYIESIIYNLFDDNDTMITEGGIATITNNEKNEIRLDSENLQPSSSYKIQVKVITNITNYESEFSEKLTFSTLCEYKDDYICKGNYGPNKVSPDVISDYIDPEVQKWPFFKKSSSDNCSCITMNDNEAYELCKTYYPNSPIMPIIPNQDFVCELDTHTVGPPTNLTLTALWINQDFKNAKENILILDNTTYKGLDDDDIECSDGVIGKCKRYPYRIKVEWADPFLGLKGDANIPTKFRIYWKKKTTVETTEYSKEIVVENNNELTQNVNSTGCKYQYVINENLDEDSNYIVKIHAENVKGYDSRFATGIVKTTKKLLSQKDCDNEALYDAHKVSVKYLDDTSTQNREVVNFNGFKKIYDYKNNKCRKMNDFEKSIVCKKIIENEPLNKVTLFSTTNEPGSSIDNQLKYTLLKNTNNNSLINGLFNQYKNKIKALETSINKKFVNTFDRYETGLDLNNNPTTGICVQKLDNLKHPSPPTINIINTKNDPIKGLVSINENLIKIQITVPVEKGTPALTHYIIYFRNLTRELRSKIDNKCIQEDDKKICRLDRVPCDVLGTEDSNCHSFFEGYVEKFESKLIELDTTSDETIVVFEGELGCEYEIKAYAVTISELWYSTMTFTSGNKPKSLPFDKNSKVGLSDSSIPKRVWTGFMEPLISPSIQEIPNIDDIINRESKIRILIDKFPTGFEGGYIDDNECSVGIRPKISMYKIVRTKYDHETKLKPIDTIIYEFDLLNRTVNFNGVQKSLDGIDDKSLYESIENFSNNQVIYNKNTYLNKNNSYGSNSKRFNGYNFIKCTAIQDLSGDVEYEFIDYDIEPATKYMYELFAKNNQIDKYSTDSSKLFITTEVIDPILDIDENIFDIFISEEKSCLDELENFSNNQSPEPNNIRIPELKPIGINSKLCPTKNITRMNDNNKEDIIAHSYNNNIYMYKVFDKYLLQDQSENKKKCYRENIINNEITTPNPFLINLNLNQDTSVQPSVNPQVVEHFTEENIRNSPDPVTNNDLNNPPSKCDLDKRKLELTETNEEILSDCGFLSRKFKNKLGLYVTWKRHIDPNIENYNNIPGNPYVNTSTNYQLIWKEVSTGVVNRSSLSSKRSMEIDNLNPGKNYKIKLYVEHTGELRLTNGFILQIKSTNNKAFLDNSNGNIVVYHKFKTRNLNNSDCKSCYIIPNDKFIKVDPLYDNVCPDGTTYDENGKCNIKCDKDIDCGMYGYCDNQYDTSTPPHDTSTPPPLNGKCKYKKEDKIITNNGIKYICKGDNYNEFSCIEVCSDQTLFKNKLYSNKNSLIERNGLFKQSKTYIDIGHSINNEINKCVKTLDQNYINSFCTDGRFIPNVKECLKFRDDEFVKIYSYDDGSCEEITEKETCDKNSTCSWDGSNCNKNPIYTCTDTGRSEDEKVPCYDNDEIGRFTYQITKFVKGDGFGRVIETNNNGFPLEYNGYVLHDQNQENFTNNDQTTDEPYSNYCDGFDVMYKKVSTPSPGSDEVVEILCANKVNLEDVLFYEFKNCKPSTNDHKKEDNKCYLTKKCIATLSNIDITKTNEHKKCMIDSDCKPNQKCQILNEDIGDDFKQKESYCVNINDNCKYGDCVISEDNFEEMNKCEFIEGTAINPSEITGSPQIITVSGNYCTKNKYYKPSQEEKNSNECDFYNYSLISYKDNLFCMQTCNTPYDCNDKCIKDNDKTFGVCQIEFDGNNKKTCRSDVDCKGITNRDSIRDNVYKHNKSLDECINNECKIRLEKDNCKESDRTCGNECSDCSNQYTTVACNEHQNCRWDNMESKCVDDSCGIGQYRDGDKCKCSKKACNNNDDCGILEYEPSFKKDDKNLVNPDISSNYDFKFNNDGNILYKIKDPLDKDYSYKKKKEFVFIKGKKKEKGCREGFIEQKNKCSNNKCDGTYHQTCNTDEDCTRCHKLGKCILPGECKLKKYEYSFFFGNCKFNNSEECSNDIMCKYTGPICIDKNHNKCSKKKNDSNCNSDKDCAWDSSYPGKCVSITENQDDEKICNLIEYPHECNITENCNFDLDKTREKCIAKNNSLCSTLNEITCEGDGIKKFCKLTENRCKESNMDIKTNVQIGGLFSKKTYTIESVINLLKEQTKNPLKEVNLGSLKEIKYDFDKDLNDIRKGVLPTNNIGFKIYEKEVDTFPTVGGDEEKCRLINRLYFLLVHRDFSVGKTLDLGHKDHRKNYMNSYTDSKKITYYDLGTSYIKPSFDTPDKNGVVTKLHNLGSNDKNDEWFNTLTLYDYSYNGHPRQLYVNPLNKYDVSDFNGNNLCRTLKYYDNETNINFKYIGGQYKDKENKRREEYFFNNYSSAKTVGDVKLGTPEYGKYLKVAGISMLAYAGAYSGAIASIALKTKILAIIAKIGWTGVAKGAGTFLAKGAIASFKAIGKLVGYFLYHVFNIISFGKLGKGVAWIKAKSAAKAAATSVKVKKASVVGGQIVKGGKAVGTIGAKSTSLGAKASALGAKASSAASTAGKASVFAAKAGKAALIAMASNPVTAAFALAVIIALVVVAIVVTNNKIYGNLGPLITDFNLSTDGEYELKLNDISHYPNKICNSMYDPNTNMNNTDRTFVPNEFGKDSDKAALFFRRRGRSEDGLCKNKCMHNSIYGPKANVDGMNYGDKRCSINGYICSNEDQCYNGNFNDIILSDNGAYTKFLDNNDRYKSKYDGNGNFMGFLDEDNKLTKNRSKMIGNDYHFSIPTDPTTSPPSEHFTNTNKAPSKPQESVPYKESHTIFDTNIKKILEINSKHKKCSETKKEDGYVSLNRGNLCNDQEDCHHNHNVPAGNHYKLLGSQDPRVWQYTTLEELQPPKDSSQEFCFSNDDLDIPTGNKISRNYKKYFKNLIQNGDQVRFDIGINGRNSHYDFDYKFKIPRETEDAAGNGLPRGITRVYNSTTGFLAEERYRFFPSNKEIIRELSDDDNRIHYGHYKNNSVCDFIYDYKYDDQYEERFEREKRNVDFRHVRSTKLIKDGVESEDYIKDSSDKETNNPYTKIEDDHFMIMDPPFWKPTNYYDDHINELDMPYDADTRYPRRTAKIKHCWCEANLDTNPWVPMTQFNPSQLPPEWNFLIDDNKPSLDLTHLKMNNIKNIKSENIYRRKLKPKQRSYKDTDTIINKIINNQESIYIDQPLVFKMNIKKGEFYMTNDLYQ